MATARLALLSNAHANTIAQWDFNSTTPETEVTTGANVPGATSPHTNPITGSQQFFRLKH